MVLCFQCKTLPAAHCCANADCRRIFCSDPNCAEPCYSCDKRICLECGKKQDHCDGCMAEEIAWELTRELEMWA